MKTRSGNGARVVLGHRAEDHRIGQRQLLAHARPYPRREHAEIYDGAFVVDDFHVLAGTIGAGIHQDEPARRLADDAGRADRHHKAEQHGNALERVGVGARDVRVRHGEGKQPYRNSHEAPGGADRVLVEPRHVEPAGLHAVEEAAQEAVGEMRDHEDRDNDYKAGRRPGHAREHPEKCVDEERREALAPWPGVRELAQDESQPLVAQQQGHRPEDRAHDRANGVQHVLALDDLVAGGAHFRALDLGVAEHALP